MCLKTKFGNKFRCSPIYPNEAFSNINLRIKTLVVLIR